MVAPKSLGMLKKKKNMRERDLMLNARTTPKTIL